MRGTRLSTATDVQTLSQIFPFEVGGFNMGQHLTLLILFAPLLETGPSLSDISKVATWRHNERRIAWERTANVPFTLRGRNSKTHFYSYG